MNARVSLSDEVRLATQIAGLIIQAGIEPDDEHFQQLLASETDVLDRLRRIIRAARMIEANGKALAAMIAEMQERKTRLEKKADALRGAVKWGLSELGQNRLESPDFTVTISAGRPKVVITDEDILPEWAVRTTVAPDKAKIKDALESGEAVPGATLDNAAPVLTVRTR